MTPDRFRFNPETMSLDPPDFKKVVYLDQFVISEIVNEIPALVRATYGEDWLKPDVTMFAPRKPNA